MLKFPITTDDHEHKQWQDFSLISLFCQFSRKPSHYIHFHCPGIRRQLKNTKKKIQQQTGMVSTGLSVERCQGQHPLSPMPGILWKALSVSMLVGFLQCSLADGLVFMQDEAFLAGTSIPEQKQQTFLTTSYYQTLVTDNNIIKSTQKPAGEAGLLSWHSMTQKENEKGLGCAEI